MVIGLLLPSILMEKRFSDRIFAPKPLFVALVNGLVDGGHTVWVYSAEGLATKGKLALGSTPLGEKDIPSIRVREGTEETQKALQSLLTRYEYELDVTARAYEHAASNGVQVMHCYQQFMAQYIGPLVRMPTVYTLHDPLFPADSLEGYRLRHFARDAYVAISKSQAALYQKAGINIVDTVYHGFSLPEVQVKAAKEYVLFLGRIIEEKGVLDAMAGALQAKIPLRIGTSDNYLTNAYARRVKDFASAHAGAFAFTGFLTDEVKDTITSEAKALLFPIGWDEAFGMVMVEAMACGTPVIAYNRGSVPEVIVDGQTGFIVDPDNTQRPGAGSWIIKKKGIEGLVEAMQRIGEIDRAACRRHVEEKFSVRQMVDGYVSVYEKITGLR